MTSYFRVRDDVVDVFLNFKRFLSIVYSYRVSASSDVNQKKILRKIASLIVFLASTLTLIGYHGNNE